MDCVRIEDKYAVPMADEIYWKDKDLFLKDFLVFGPLIDFRIVLDYFFPCKRNQFLGVFSRNEGLFRHLLKQHSYEVGGIDENTLLLFFGEKKVLDEFQIEANNCVIQVVIGLQPL